MVCLISLSNLESDGGLFRRKLLEQTHGDEGGQGNISSVLLHLLLRILRTLEGEVLESGQHSSPGVDSAHQFIG